MDHGLLAKMSSKAYEVWFLHWIYEGQDNVVVDALSRIDVVECNSSLQLQSILLVLGCWFESAKVNQGSSGKFSSSKAL